MTSEREKCTEENGFWEGAEVISSYSPEQGVEDGVLVDVTATFREAGLPGLKCYMTRAAWEDCVAWDDSDGRRKGIHQDEAGRLWDVATMTRAVIQMLGSMDAGDTARVPVTRVPRAGKGRKPRLTFLKAGLEGGFGFPVLTVMLQGED